jgi:hypothetical protein
MRQNRYFTLEEANRLIPTLEQELSELRTLRQDLEELGGELSPLFEVIRHNGGHRKTPRFLQLAQELGEILERIKSHGCLIKNVDPGLIDFPHIREGREVYLCWRSGEEEIQYWHDIDAGFAGRQSI